MTDPKCLGGQPGVWSSAATPGLNVSFEFFPPERPIWKRTLWHAISRLAPLGPLSYR